MLLNRMDSELRNLIRERSRKRLNSNSCGELYRKLKCHYLNSSNSDSRLFYKLLMETSRCDQFSDFRAVRVMHAETLGVNDVVKYMKDSKIGTKEGVQLNKNSGGFRYWHFKNKYTFYTKYKLNQGLANSSILMFLTFNTVDRCQYLLNLFSKKKEYKHNLHDFTL